MAKNQNLTMSGVIWDVFKDILFFPFWWYSFGLIKTVKNLINFILNQEKSLAFSVWLKNIFVPMYGSRDWQGIIISFFVRIVQIIVRGAILLFIILIALALFWAWIIFPFLIVYMIFIYGF